MPLGRWRGRRASRSIPRLDAPTPERQSQAQLLRSLRRLAVRTRFRTYEPPGAHSGEDEAKNAIRVYAARRLRRCAPVRACRKRQTTEIGLIDRVRRNAASCSASVAGRYAEAPASYDEARSVR